MCVMIRDYLAPLLSGNSVTVAPVSGEVSYKELLKMDWLELASLNLARQSREQCFGYQDYLLIEG